jgi:hypothetical protein
VISIFTPFFFDVEPSSNALYPSAGAKTLGDRIVAYLDCALCMFWSARTYYPEARLIFIVNDAAMIGALHSAVLKKLNVDIVELEAKSVPEGAVRFKGAFFKLDAISYIASAGSEFNIMLDNDALFTKRDQMLDFFIERRCNLAYAISKPGYNYESKVYLNELFGKLSGKQISADCEWVGGEFVAGTPQYFEAIDWEIKKSIQNYWEIHSTLHHIGDEVLLSCAISMIRDKGLISIVLYPHVIYRYWSRGVIGYGQLHYELLSQIPILHLPDQKLHGFRKLASIIQKQPHVIIPKGKLARIMGFSPLCKEALYRNPLAMLRRTLPMTIRSALQGLFN